MVEHIADRTHADLLFEELGAHLADTRHVLYIVSKIAHGFANIRK